MVLAATRFNFTDVDKLVKDDFFAPVTGIEAVEYAGTSDLAVNIGVKAQAAGVRSVKVTGTQANIVATTATVDLTLVAGTTTSDVSAGSGTDTITGGDGVNVITTSEGDDSITGGTGADDINVNGAKSQTVTLTDYGVGADIIDIDNAKATVNATFGVIGGLTLGTIDIVSGGTLNTTITDAVAVGNTVDFSAGGTQSGNVVISSAANDNGIAIIATSGTDTITAGAGNDTITGGGGIDSIVGGKGNDVLLISATGAQVAGDSFDGGEGTNNIVVANGTAAMAAEFDMDKIDDVLTIETTGAGDTSKNTTLTFSDIAETTAQTVVVDGTSLTAADLVVTNNADSTTTTFNITGGGVDDTIAGSNGADTLSGGAGKDTPHR